MFCPKCGSIMKPVGNQWVCANNKCKYSQQMEHKEEVHAKKDKIAKPTDKKTAVVEEDISILPITNDVECPKCGNNSAYWILRQTRAADEPETKIFECTKCHHKWREY